MKNEYKNNSVVLADTQYLTNEAIHSMLSPLFHAFYTVSTKAGLQQYLQKETISLIITDDLLFDFDSINDLADVRKKHPETGIVVLTNAITGVRLLKKLTPFNIN